MANKKISQLNPVTTLTGNDTFPVVQGTETKKAKISDVKNYIPTATSLASGLLSNTDWSTFNNKQNSLTLGNLTESTSSVLTITGGTGSVIGSGLSIQVKQASASQSGYLSSSDWSTFNSKMSGLTLTTTGTSGAATLVGSTLNVPQYLGSALTTLGGQTGATQTFSVDTTGVDFTITSAANNHKFSIPNASSSSRGLLTAADYTTFNSKEPAVTKGNLTESTSSVLTITGGTGSVIGSGTTIQVKQANGSQSGFLSTGDWTTFNAKQGALTLTTTGSSGAATLVNNVLNVPQYSGNAGTVTSIATSSPITGGTITGSGTIGITQATTSTNGYLSSTDWNTFNGKQGSLTLTTTGSSGAATLVGNTLNIPQYSGGGGTDTINWTHTQALPTIGSTIKAEPVFCTLPNLTNTTATIFSQRIVLVAVWIPSAMTITGVKWIQSTAGTFVASNFNGVALYTLSAGTFTRQAVSANDSTIFSTAGSNVMKNKAFTSTYSASAGLHYAAIMYSASSGTAPNIFKTPDPVYNSWTLDNTGGTSGFYLSMFATGQTTFPTTLSPAGLFLQSNVPYLALY